MPVVPKSQSQVQLQGMPNLGLSANAPSEAFGAGQSMDKVMGAVSQVGKAYLEEKRKADQIAFMDADAKLSALQTRLEFDPDIGFQNKKGKESFGAPDSVHGDWTKGLEEIEGSLSNDDQKMAFRKSAQQRWADLDKGVQRHVGAEIRQYDNQTTESYIKNEVDAAVTNYKDPERVNMSLQRLQAATIDYAQRNGMPEEELKQKLTAIQSQAHSGIVNRFLANGDDMSASNYFNANKDKLSGDVASKLEKDLEEGSLRGNSQRISDGIMSKRMSMSQAMDEVKKIEDPRLRDAASDRVRQGYQMQEMARRDSLEKMHINATNIIDKYGTIDAIPPNQWTQFSLGERSQLINYAKAKTEGRDIPTKWDVYQDIKTMAATPAYRDKFLQMDIVGEHMNNLGKPELKEVINLQASLRNGDEKSSRLLDGYLSDKQRVDSVLASAGLDPGTKNKSKKEQLANFRKRLDDEVIKMQERTGKKVNNIDLENLASELLVKGITEKGLIWDTEKFKFEVSDTDKFEVDIKSIPKAEREKIESALKRRNAPATDAKVLELYLRKSKGSVSGI